MLPGAIVTDAPANATDRNRQYHVLEAMLGYTEAEAWQFELIAERLRQLDSGDIAYASRERVEAIRATRTERWRAT